MAEASRQSHSPDSKLLDSWLGRCGVGGRLGVRLRRVFLREAQGLECKGQRRIMRAKGDWENSWEQWFEGNGRRCILEACVGMGGQRKSSNRKRRVSVEPAPSTQVHWLTRGYLDAGAAVKRLAARGMCGWDAAGGFHCGRDCALSRVSACRLRSHFSSAGQRRTSNCLMLIMLCRRSSLS
jgi:hypothetical protein